MDLRVKRTIESIENAYIKLREKKAIEKISVKELSELAMINKATFYLHYKDIYDLAETVENKMIDTLFNTIGPQDSLLDDIKKFTVRMFFAYLENRIMLDTVFSGSRKHELIDKIEYRIKSEVFSKHPEKADDLLLNTMLTYEIKGSYYAFSENQTGNPDEVIEIISTACDALDNMLHK